MNPMVYRQRIDRPHPVVIFCAPREPLLALEVAMGMGRWNPRRETTRQEESLLKRLHRTRKLFGFLRRYRHELRSATAAAPRRSRGASPRPLVPQRLPAAAGARACRGAPHGPRHFWGLHAKRLEGLRRDEVGRCDSADTVCRILQVVVSASFLAWPARGSSGRTCCPEPRAAWASRTRRRPAETHGRCRSHAAKVNAGTSAGESSP